MKISEYHRSVNISINMNAVAPLFIRIYGAWKLIFIVLILSMLALVAYRNSLPIKHQAIGLLEIGRVGRNIIEPRERMVERLKLPLSYTESTLRSCKLAPTVTSEAIQSVTRITHLRGEPYAVQITTSLSSGADAKQCLSDLVTMIQEQHRVMEKASWEERMPYVQNIKSIFFADNKLAATQRDIQLVFSIDEFFNNYSTTRLIAPIHTQTETKAGLQSILVWSLLASLLLGICAAIGRNFQWQHQQRAEQA